MLWPSHIFKICTILPVFEPATHLTRVVYYATQPSYTICGKKCLKVNISALLVLVYTTVYKPLLDIIGQEVLNSFSVSYGGS